MAGPDPHELSTIGKSRAGPDPPISRLYFVWRWSVFGPLLGPKMDQIWVRFEPTLAGRDPHEVTRFGPARAGPDPHEVTRSGPDRSGPDPHELARFGSGRSPREAIYWAHFELKSTASRHGFLELILRSL